MADYLLTKTNITLWLILGGCASVLQYRKNWILSTESLNIYYHRKYLIIKKKRFADIYLMF